MRTLLFYAVAGAVGLISADASADRTRERYPGAACVSAHPDGLADIRFNTNGEVENIGTTTRVVSCPVPIYYQIDADQMAHVSVRLKQSTNCTLRFTNTDGTVFKTISQTATRPELRFDATERGFFSANLRCSLPASGELISYDVQREGQ